MRGHLFPMFIESELAAGFKCGFCSNSGQALYLSPPRWKRSGTDIQIFYPTRCGACGRVSNLTISMPILLFGFTLAWSRMFASGRQPGKGVEKCIIPSKPKSFVSICREFSDLLSQHGGSVASLLSNTDRIQFGFTPQEWSEFAKRLGFEGEDKNIEQ